MSSLLSTLGAQATANSVKRSGTPVSILLVLYMTYSAFHFRDDKDIYLINGLSEKSQLKLTPMTRERL